MAESEVYDQQLNFAKYLEISKYNFTAGYLHNPLVPIIQPDIIIPFLPFSNLNKCLCTENVKVIRQFDRKPINCVKMFSNSKKVLYGTNNGNLVQCDIYNSFSHSPVNSQFNSSASIRAMQFTKNESYLLIGDGEGFIHYFTSGLKPGNTLFKVHNYTITDISFSISDTQFVTSSDDKVSKIFDFITGAEVISFKEHLSHVKTCDWNPYKNLVASGGKDALIKIWDPSTGQEIASLKHLHKNSINRLRFNKNGNWLLSASKDHLLKIIDIRMMKEFQTFKGHEYEVNTMVWHPVYEEIFCSAGADKNIIYWKVGENKNFIFCAHDKEIFDLCFNQTGTLLASGSNDFTLKLWTRNSQFF